MKTRTETRATRPPIVERLAAIRRQGLAGTTHGYRLEACVVLAELLAAHHAMVQARTTRMPLDEWQRCVDRHRDALSAYERVTTGDAPTPPGAFLVEFDEGERF